LYVYSEKSLDKGWENERLQKGLQKGLHNDRSKRKPAEKVSKGTGNDNFSAYCAYILPCLLPGHGLFQSLESVMTRPKKVDRPTRKHLSLPESLVARVELELYSPLEGKVPTGAWAEFVEHLIREYFEKKDNK
jgi:hypothetical protein